MSAPEYNTRSSAVLFGAYRVVLLCRNIVRRQGEKKIPRDERCIMKTAGVKKAEKAMVIMAITQ